MILASRSRSTTPSSVVAAIVVFGVMSIQERNEGIMRQWFEGGVWGAETDDAAEAFIDAHYAEDGRAYGIGGEFQEGPGPFKAFRRALVAAFPQQRFTLTHLHAHDEQVWLRWEAELTDTKGDKRSLVGGGVLEMADGKITKAWNLVNFLDLVEEVGSHAKKGALVGTFSTLAGS